MCITGLFAMAIATVRHLGLYTKIITGLSTEKGGISGDILLLSVHVSIKVILEIIVIKIDYTKD